MERNNTALTGIKMMIADGIVTQEAAEKYFPELKESEEKMIKKEITELVMQPTWKTEKEFQRRKELCAWLEKQKVLTAEEDPQGKEDVLWCIKQAEKHAKDENEMGTCWFAEKWLEKHGKKEPDPRYENLEELLAADTIYQMAMNEAMVEEAKTKAINALSELAIGKLLELEKQDKQNLANSTKNLRG